MNEARAIALLRAGAAAMLVCCGRAPDRGAASTTAPLAAEPLVPASDAASDAPSPSSGEPDAAVAPVTPAASAPSSPWKGPMTNQRSADDLAWLTELVTTLADRPATREHVIAFLGEDAGPGRDEHTRVVRPRSPFLKSVLVYPLPHVRIDVALDIELGPELPTRAALERALGPARSMPRNPDDFRSGPKVAIYREGKVGTVRVFAELQRGNDPRVAKLHIDLDGVR